MTTGFSILSDVRTGTILLSGINDMAFSS